MAQAVPGATRPCGAGNEGQMTWIRGGPSSLDGRNIKEAIDGSLKRLGTDYIDLYQLHWPDRYVPMFGDRDYDPSCSYSSVSIEEQLQALGVAVKEDQKHWCEQRNSVWGDGILPSGRTEQLTSSDYYHPECIQSIVSDLRHDPC